MEIARRKLIIFYYYLNVIFWILMN